jgi:hypothetical protein
MNHNGSPDMERSRFSIIKKSHLEVTVMCGMDRDSERKKRFSCLILNSSNGLTNTIYSDGDKIIIIIGEQKSASRTHQNPH